MDKDTNSFRNRIFIVIACCLINLTIGSIYLWGTLSTYVNSFFQSSNKNLSYN